MGSSSKLIWAVALGAFFRFFFGQDIFLGHPDFTTHIF